MLFVVLVVFYEYGRGTLLDLYPLMDGKSACLGICLNGYKFGLVVD